jgi:hypothetical protein
MNLVRVSVGAKHQYVIKVNSNKPIKAIPQDRIHEPLEGCRRIAEPERHNDKLVEAVSGCKRCFEFMPLMNSDLMVPGTQVNQSKHTSTTQTIK